VTPTPPTRFTLAPLTPQAAAVPGLDDCHARASLEHHLFGGPEPDYVAPVEPEGDAGEGEEA
jgi:hypothetical protein